MVQSEIKLEVSESHDDDEYRGIARIGPEHMLELDIRPGDTGIITGDKSTPVVF